MQKTVTHDDLLESIVKNEKEALDFGFYWENPEQILEQLESECSEIRQALLNKDHANLKEEIGDLMHASISLCIFLNLNPTELLRDNIEKYQARYEKLVELVKKDGLENLKGKSMDVLMSYWNQVKKTEKG